jgi:N-acyl-D-amino-acid deacylase
MFGTDGSALSRHPRGHGTFARVFARHVGESGGVTLTLESAVRKATQLPAATIGLDDRGELRAGAFADVIAFDPKSFEDRADFEHPDRLAVGMRHVLVGGVIEWRDGKTVKGSGGRALRRKP